MENYNHNSITAHINLIDALEKTVRNRDVSVYLHINFRFYLFNYWSLKITRFICLL